MNNKNVLIIDPGQNCEYAVYAMTLEEFAVVFPGRDQNVEFIEDLEARIGEPELIRLLKPVWERRVRKVSVVGLHGTLFYQMQYKKPFYPVKNDERMVDLFGVRPLNRWHSMPSDEDASLGSE